MSPILTYTSTLPLSECIQRLEKLTAQKNYFITVGHSTAHIKIDDIEFNTKNSKTAFKLHARCAYEEKYSEFVSLELDGELQSSGNETEMQFRIQLYKPFSIFWKILALWGILITFALLGILPRISKSKSIDDLYIIVAVVFLACINYSWKLHRSYKLGLSGIPKLVYQVLRHEPITLDKNQSLPDWIAASSKPR